LEAEATAGEAAAEEEETDAVETAEEATVAAVATRGIAVFSSHVPRAARR